MCIRMQHAFFTALCTASFVDPYCCVLFGEDGTIFRIYKWLGWQPP